MVDALDAMERGDHAEASRLAQAHNEETATYLAVKFRREPVIVRPLYCRLRCHSWATGDAWLHAGRPFS